MAPRIPGTSLPPIEIFAVSDRSAQLTWRGLGAGALEIRVDDGVVHVLGDADQPSAVELMGLRPNADHHLDVLVDRRLVHQLAVRTLASPGDDLVRIATISDLHLGETGFGLLRPLRERGERVGFPMRCAVAAVEEAQAWGAELLVIKGDITSHGYPEEWELFDELLRHIKVPTMAIPGNHDGLGRSRSIDPVEALLARDLAQAPVVHQDIGPVRVATVDSTIPGKSRGRLRATSESLVEAVGTDLPVCLFSHHHLEARALPSVWPLGVSMSEHGPILDRMLEANPDIFISSGHTHRNRTRRHQTAFLSEVSATKDYPGVWAGYTIGSAGIQQVVRRIAEPSCVAWNDRTHAVIGGVWGRWTPGPLDQRSFCHKWTRQPAVVPDPARVGAEVNSSR